MRFLTLILTVLAGQVQALSCVPPDVRWSFNHADESEDRYFVLRGRFEFPDYTFPESTDPNQDRSLRVQTQFTGHVFTRRGFTNPKTQDVTLEISCLGPWCGGAVPNQEYVAFAKETDAGLVVEVSACSWALLNPSPGQEAQLIDCVNGRSCKPDFP